MPMGRPRKPGNKDLPDGLYPPDEYGCWRMRHPLTGRKKSLKTKEKDEAITLYWELKRRYEPQVRQKILEQLEESQSFTVYLKTYRESHLPKAKNKHGRPLGKETIKTYRNYIKNAEQDEALKVPIRVFNDPNEGPRIIRQYLAPWIDHPKTYNYRLTCFARVFNRLIDEGELVRNPCRDIEGKVSHRTKTYMPDDDFILVSNKLAEMYHEVYAVICDWLYVMSGRPTNMLDVKESEITKTEIAYYASKNDQPVIVEMDSEILALVEWFRNYKREQKIVSPYLIVHPKTARRGLAAKNVTRENFYRYFKNAARAVDMGHYRPQHIRPKAMTDEAMLAGKATDKGAHKTQAMREYYVVITPPKRIKNNLKRLRNYGEFS